MGALIKVPALSRMVRRGGAPHPNRPRYGRPRAIFNAATWLLLALLLAATGAPLGAAGKIPRILALGDSLTAGHGLPAEEALPVRLQARLAADGIAAELINAGVSGDTTAGGLARLDWVLATKPDIVMVELGANDCLRGLDPKTAYENLDQILTRIKAAGAKVLLVGMLSPPNWGDDYKRQFDAIYPALAEKHRVPLDPFILAGVAMDPNLNQPDMLHPNARGVEVLAARIAPYLERLIRGS
jgi:acyl-CoA thioesterase-1